MIAVGSAAPARRASLSARVYGRVVTDPDARWSPLLVCVSLYLLCGVARIHQLWPAVGALRPTLLSGAGALMLIALDPGTTARLRATWRIPAIRWLTAMFVWATLSIPVALWPGGAFDIVVNNLFKGMAMLVATVVAVRGVRDVRRLAFVYYLSAVVFALVVLQDFQVEQATERLGRLVYYDANEFALLAAASLPFGLYAAWSVKNLVWRVLIVASMGALFTVFVSCGSRGGMLALGAGLLYTVLSLRAIKLRWRIAAFAVVSAAFVASASDQFWDRMDSAVGTKDDYNLTSPTGRVQVWQRGIGYMLDRPLFGVGAGNFQTAEGKLSDYATGLRARSAGVKWSAAHNSYVQVGAELGVPGVVFFACALFGTIFTLARIARPRKGAANDPELVALASASTVALITFAVGASFLSLAYHDMLFALFAIAMSVQVVAARQAPPNRVNRV